MLSFVEIGFLQQQDVNKVLGSLGSSCPLDNLLLDIALLIDSISRGGVLIAHLSLFLLLSHHLVSLEFLDDFRNLAIIGM